MGNEISFEAVGSRVYMVADNRKELFCIISDKMLTAKSAAEETAAALNAHMKR